jgi:ferric iron reductase protein FhuF
MSAISVDLLPIAPIRPAPVRCPHPLAEPLQRIARQGGRARAGLGLAGRPLDAWALATELADSPSPRLERSLRRIGVQAGTADRLVMTSQFFSSYVWQLATAALGCYLAAGRVPDVSAENVAVHIGDDGRADEIRFLGGGFAVIAGDPTADHPDAVVVQDRASLRDLLVRRLTTGHLEELILALQSQRGLGTRALWAALEDRCLGALLWLSHALDLTDIVEAEATALNTTPPFVGTSDIAAVETEHGRTLTLKRGFCCLVYRIDGKGRCSTCPLRTGRTGTRTQPALAPCAADPFRSGAPSETL